MQQHAAGTRRGSPSRVRAALVAFGRPHLDATPWSFVLGVHAKWHQLMTSVSCIANREKKK
jgi:hypothetical protein